MAGPGRRRAAGQRPGGRYTLWAALAETLNALAAPGLAYLLLRRLPQQDLDRPSFQRFQWLLGSAAAGALAGALLCTALLLLTGSLAVRSASHVMVQTGMGSMLGVVLITPLVLSYRRTLLFSLPTVRLYEGLAAWLLASLVAMAVFGPLDLPALAPLANAYWMFLFALWSGMRLGLLGTCGLLNLLALHTLWGTLQRTGFFAHDLDASAGFGCWSFLMLLGVCGLSLAAYMAERGRQKAALRIAATAFDCQEGLLITDAKDRIVQANPAFLQLTGYTLAEVQGRSPQFLNAPGAGTPEQPGIPRAPAANAQLRTRLLRKGGDTFPAWVSITPVQGGHAAATHYVISLQDITSLEEYEQRLTQHAQTQRDALVREVHHRIKNHLQGIVGLLRTLGHEHAGLQGPIEQVAQKIHHIATIHGLQGRSSSEDVPLQELARAVADSIAQSWSTPITVEAAAGLPPWQLASSEAVPVALVLGELMVNAVKHGGQAARQVQVLLLPGPQAAQVQVRIANPGLWPAPTPAPPRPGSGRGLDLIALLMPRTGAALQHHQVGPLAVATLELSAPVVHTPPPP